MAATAAQIVALACEAAHSPGKTTQAQQLLNAILGDLCETYDFALARGLFNFTFNPGLSTQFGSGPYVLPADYLRTSGSSGSTGAQKSTWWSLNGVQYPMVPIDLSEFDMQVQMANQSSYPYLWATDMSQSPPVGFAYPPPSGAYPVMLRYQRQMPDIDFSGSVPSPVNPWFPNSVYLITRLTGELCKLNDDERWTAMLGDGAHGAVGILRKYLELKDDDTNRSKYVQLDRRFFGQKFATLPNTKAVGF